jgi:hypothetical protein
MPFALSLSQEVEKFGAYAGLAAFFGFAVLALLHFAQAREVRRLREWAGRAPERAAELEARVASDAARRAQARPQTVSPAQPGTSLTAPATAAGAAPAPAAAAGAAAPATAAGTATATAPAPAAPVPGDQPKTEGEPAADQATATAGDGAAPPDAGPEPETEQSAAPAGNGAPAAGALGAGAQPPQPQSEDSDEDSEDADADADAEGAPAGNGSGEMAGVPRATPAPTPRPPVQLPRRAPAPAAALRQTGPATRRPSPPPRRPGAPPQPAPSRGRGRTILVVAGGVLAVAVAVVGATQLLGRDSGTTGRPNVTAASTPAPTTTAGSSSGTSATKATRANTTVSILNGTTVTGLAASIADKIQTAGFKRGNVQNYSDQARSASLVFYSDGGRRLAIEVAKILGLSADDVEAIDPDTQALAGQGAKVVVVVGNDQAQ